MGRIFITGDKHAKPICIRDAISQIDNPSEDDIIIIAGDAGFEYQEYVMGQAKMEARKFPGKWIVLRGNHDSRYWNHEGDPGWEITEYQNCEYLYQKKYPNIWYLPDTGCIYTLNNYNILFIPGAYSVDKWYRLRSHYPWNPYEQLTDKEKDELNLLVYEWIDLGFDIDFVIAHTFPSKIESYYNDLFMEELDQSSVDKSTEDWLNSMADLYEKASGFKQYFGGHFHSDRTLTDKYTMVYHSVKNLADYVKE